ncbi:putative NADPH-dependent 1-acyl dihydroxyacetone phosphate reductase [Poronia punctata]|nr:putative NADPH-dependent 1-acyl dihydroxyacetone phosphate reductase [Poronia punctata]
MPQTIVLITGASRGLGKALAQRYLSLPDHTVIALNRKPKQQGPTSLENLPRGPNTTLITVAYDAQDERSAFEAVKELREEHSIDHLDVVVANAAMAKDYPLARDARRADILEHVAVNACSVIELFQATRDLLRASPGEPIFAPMGSGAGGLGRQAAVPNSVYGASKSMVYWYGVRISAEEEWLNTFVIDPGWVQTELGNEAGRILGLGDATLSVDESVDGVFTVLRTATKEKYGGKSVLYTGEVLPW